MPFLVGRVWRSSNPGRVPPLPLRRGCKIGAPVQESFPGRRMIEEPRVTTVSLIADVGATNARFALLGATGEIERVRVLACADYPSIGNAIEAYLGQEQGLTPSGTQRPRAAALAIAGPVTGERVALTNHPWSFAIGELRRRLSVDRLLVVNDFTAVAAAIPHLKSNDSNAVGGGSAVAAAPIGVVGPGSGLGVGGLIPMGDRWF